MKRNFTFLMAAFALMVSMMMPLGMKVEFFEWYDFDAENSGRNLIVVMITSTGWLWESAALLAVISVSWMDFGCPNIE